MSTPQAVPSVSVVIPTFNRAALLVEAIESVMAQSYRDFEVVVVDDGSTDDTRERLAPFGERVRYFWQENAGEPAARNAGVRRARGRFVAFLDSDDRWEPTLLEAGLGDLAACPQAGLVAFGRQEIDGRGQRTGNRSGKRSPGPWFTTRSLLGPDWRTVGMPVVRREHLIDAGVFDETIRIGTDMHQWLRLSLRCGMRYVSEPLYLWRRHAGITNTLELRRWDMQSVDAFSRILASAEASTPSLRRQCRRLRGRLRMRLVRDSLRERERPGADVPGRAELRRLLNESIRLDPFCVRSYVLWVKLAVD